MRMSDSVTYQSDKHAADYAVAHPPYALRTPRRKKIPARKMKACSSALHRTANAIGKKRNFAVNDTFAWLPMIGGDQC